MKMEKKVENTVYLIGIGGIGMSALARWYKANGFNVAGYDKTSTDLTKALSDEGIWIHFTDDVKDIPIAFTGRDVLIVYTPAVPKEHSELQFFISQGNRIIKRSEALGEITKTAFTIAVAGTHGKTTTSSMIAHVLKNAGKNVFAFLGGITQNYHTNILFGKAGEGEEIMVVEADEYDRSFLRLHPDIAVITAMDPDHLDIYQNKAEFISAFDDFALKVKEGGEIILKEELTVHIPTGVKTTSFGIASSEYRALVKDEQTFTFDIDCSNDAYHQHGVRLLLPGRHNIMNALAAYAVATSLGIPASKIREGIESFKGVKRRFEYHVNTSDLIYIDDYAHHPTEIEAVLGAIQSLYHGKRISVVFQPHLYTRTRDFMEGFGKSLSLADEVILLDIYPARELPLPGITSEKLLEHITAPEKRLLKREALAEYLGQSKSSVFITLGAGDIDQLVQPLTTLFNSKIVDK